MKKCIILDNYIIRYNIVNGSFKKKKQYRKQHHKVQKLEQEILRDNAIESPFIKCYINIKYNVNNSDILKHHFMKITVVKCISMNHIIFLIQTISVRLKHA